MRESSRVEVSAAPTAKEIPRCRRWLRRGLGAGSLVILLVILHEPLLRGLADGLIEDAPLEPADAVVILAENDPITPVPFDEAGAIYRDRFAERVVLVEDASARVVRIGIAPHLEGIARRELTGCGVPEAAFTILVRTDPGDWEQARGLQSWLRDHPGERVTVLSRQLVSRRMACAFHQVLTPEEAARVRWRAIPDRRFDRTNWWRSRQGIVTVVSEYISLGFVILHGENREPSYRWDPDAYEQTLREAH